MGERDWSFQSNGPSEALKPRTFFPCSSWTDWRCPAPWTHFCVPSGIPVFLQPFPSSLSALPPVLTQVSSSPWNPTPAPVSIPSLLLPIPAIVFIAVGVYLLLLGLVLLIRHCLLAQGCCTDCSSPCRKPSASERQDCCWTCAEACDFPLPSPALCLDACCPQPTEAGWAPHCPHCCPLCDCACACQLPDCQSLNCLCFEIKLR
ncbi:keratin-associated protein 10-11 isoform X2 [Elephas maximus indicus]|uniref:keratin-associated protein 10-11 isoform X2 n=1 Tax=Elephas maximus indicus TaxID=99487 RepID=UPI0021165EC5|nr:keratin-associated protein 10-11 isoform X2 [Elephas maximus indicus]